MPVISEATVSFRNEVGEKFQLTQARFTVDGIELPAIALDVAQGKETVIFKGPMTSGRHVITSHLSYQGRNRAIFTYLDGYTLNLESKDEVFVVSGAPSSVTCFVARFTSVTTMIGTTGARYVSPALTPVMAIDGSVTSTTKLSAAGFASDNDVASSLPA